MTLTRTVSARAGRLLTRAARLLARQTARAVFIVAWPERRPPTPPGTTLASMDTLSIELHDGRVVSVWFRGEPLPFTARPVTPDRAAAVAGIYLDPLPKITGVDTEC